MENFNFISDEEFRDTLVNDFIELESCLKNNCHKSVLILSGSIIEAILSDYLLGLKNTNLSKSDILRYDLNTLITKCRKLDVLSEKSKNLSDVVRSYRNLIHPGKTIRTKNIPDENDALVAKALVEMIIKEVNTKKQESYGFTAEQLLTKIQNDRTTEVVWHHFFKKTNNYEKKKLLLSLIPQDYYRLIDDVFNEDIEDDLNLLSKFFLATFSTVSEEIKKEVANKFVSIMLEGNRTEVEHNISSFFSVEYLKYLNTEDKEFVIEHLFGIIQDRSQDGFINILEGISNYLSDKQFNRLVKLLFIKSIQTTTKDSISFSTEIFKKEYDSSTEERKQAVLKYLDSRIKQYSYNERIIGLIQRIRDYMTGDDLPF